jgi:hypothetical protein
MFYRGATAPLYLRAARVLLFDLDYILAPATLAWYVCIYMCVCVRVHVCVCFILLAAPECKP